MHIEYVFNFPLLVYHGINLQFDTFSEVFHKPELQCLNNINGLNSSLLNETKASVKQSPLI